MKNKITLLGAIAMISALSLHAAPKDEVEKILKANNIKVQVKSVQELGDGLNLVEIQSGKSITLAIASEKGKILLSMPDSILSADPSISKSVSKAQLKLNENNAKNANTALKDVFKEYDKYVFSFKAKKNTDKIIYIISDPVCPYCKEELDRLNTRLNSVNVKMLVVGALGSNAMSKAAYINANKTENQSKNLALLKKIYHAKSAPKKVDESKTKEITNKAMSTGIRGVPYVFE